MPSGITAYLSLRLLVIGFLDSNRAAPTVSVNSKRFRHETATDSSAVMHSRIDRQRNETRPRRLLVPVPSQTKALKR